MRHILTRAANQLLAAFGMALVRRPTGPSSWTPLEAALHGILSAKNCISIVQIGANDGKWNDPLHNFLIQETQRTRVLFVEPQPEVAGFLMQTYEEHPFAKVFVGAITRLGHDVSLFRIKPELWESTAMPYLRDAPCYRAPSGFASTLRSHVEAHARNLRWRSNGAPVPLDEAIEQQIVPALTFSQLSAMHPDIFPVDVLQIDVEGLDIELVDAAFDAGIHPAILNFEVRHFSSEQRNDIVSRLKTSGYRLTHTGGDLLAIRGRGSSRG